MSAICNSLSFALENAEAAAARGERVRNAPGESSPPETLRTRWFGVLHKTISAGWLFACEQAAT